MTASHRFAMLVGWIAAFTLLVSAIPAAAQKAAEDKSKHAQVGLASVYGHKFAGKKTASGKRFKPSELTAASRKLPLNSKAKVTNLQTGKSTNVTITDRGPYKKGRVVDLSPKAARRIGLSKKQGLAPVVVKPLAPRDTHTREAVANTSD